MTSRAVAQKGHELFDDIRQRSACRPEIVSQSVDAERALRDRIFRVDVGVIDFPGREMIDEFDAADFDDAIALAGIDAGGFRVENDFTQHRY